LIIFCERGRLGNQLFQYSCLRDLYQGEELVLVGLDELSSFVESVDARTVSSASLPPWLPVGRLDLVLRVLSKLRIIGLVSESQSQDSYVVTRRRGLFRSIFLASGVYFHHREVADRLGGNFKIRESNLIKARKWLRADSISQVGQNLVFVHVRRGDYVSWPSIEHPAILEFEWYRSAMDMIRSSVKKPTFLILTDDREYCTRAFRGQADVHISPNSSNVDLAIMSLCNSGVLSASSFSWWGAKLSREKQAGGVYLAPKHWAGHQRAELYPPGFTSSWITYI
jgi:hypothetical protein